MAKDTRNFKVKEFLCKCCGGGSEVISQELINLCQTIREKVNVPLNVNSGYRCAKHNAKVGGVKNSYHTQGLAADLSGSCGALKIYEAVRELYANDQEVRKYLGYCIYYAKRNFVHVDIGAKRKSGNVFEVRK